jgi:tetratricopeptide (TPR) repeat protein
MAQDHFVLARDYERRGMPEMAGRLYETAFEYMPESRFLRKVLVNKYIQAQEHDKALSLFKNSKLSDLDSEEKRVLGLVYARAGELAKAAEAIESLEREMGGEEIYSLAVLYESLGLRDKSLAAFRQFFCGGGDMTFGVGVRLVQFNIGERKLDNAEDIAVVLRDCFPQNAEAVTLLGTVKYLKRDTLKAVECFNAALVMDSLNEEALRTLAHLRVVREEYSEAVSVYKRLVSLSENGRVYRRGLAFMLFHIKDFEGAEALLDTIIQERTEHEIAPPALKELHLYRGLIYSQTERREMAAQEFQTALAIDSLYEDAWKELCFLYITAKEKEKALAGVEQYVAALPLSGTGWRFSGYVLNMQEKYEQAAVSLKKAVSIDSSDHFAWFELGSSLERLKRIDEAADAFRKVLALNPRDAHASNYLGYMWAENGIMLDSAKTLIEDALEKDPQNGAFLDSYAWVFYQLGDYQKAHHYMKEALKHIDNDPVPYAHMGDILFKLKEYKQAQDAYKRAVELKSEESERIQARLLEINTFISREGR